jgi:hypothetical protein
MALFLIVGTSGASGAVCGVRLLDALRVAKVPAHLILPQVGGGDAEGGGRAFGRGSAHARRRRRCRIGLNHFSGQMPNSLKALIAPGW